MIMLSTLAFGLLFAQEPAGPAATAASHEPVGLVVFVDSSLSSGAVRELQGELAREAASTLAPQDRFALYSFRGFPEEVRPFGPVGTAFSTPAGMDEVLDALPRPDGLVTFYGSLFNEVLDGLHAANPGLPLVALVISDTDGSDPLNQRAESRTRVDDMVWTRPSPGFLAETPVFWALFGASAQRAPGSTELPLLDGRGSLIYWNPPSGFSTPADADLAQALSGTYPMPVPSLTTPAPEPFEPPWRLIGLLAFGLAGLVAAGRLRGPARAWAQKLAGQRRREQARRASDRRLEQEARRTTHVEVVPLWTDRVSAEILPLAEGESRDVARQHSVNGGVRWPELPHPGFMLSRRDGAVEIRSRTFDSFFLRRSHPLSEHTVEFNGDRAAIVKSGDVVTDSEGTELVELVLAEPSPSGGPLRLVH